MRVAITLPPSIDDWEGTSAYVEEAERLGVDFVWSSEAWGHDAPTPLAFGNVGTRARRRLQRLARSPGQRHLVHVSLVGEPSPPGCAAHDLDRLAQASDRPVERNAVPAFDPETQTEPSSGHRSQTHRGHRDQCGRASPHLHDPRAQPDARRAPRGKRHDRWTRGRPRTPARPRSRRVPGT